MKKTTLTLLAATAAMLTACSTMNKKECAVANWADLGFSDGSKGRTMSYFEERANDCAEYNVIADRASYSNARNQGLKNYCTEASGFTQGSNGKTYKGVCSGASAQQFLSGYHKGKRIYNQKKRVQDLRNKLKQTDRDIASKENDISRWESRLFENTNPSERDYLYRKINNTRSDINQLQYRKGDLIEQYQFEQIRLDEMQYNRL